MVEPRADVAATVERRTGQQQGQRFGVPLRFMRQGGALNFNRRLLPLSVRLIDYVIVHELAYLLEHNQTPEFWQVLDQALPDWRERKAAMECRWQEFAVFGIDESGAHR